MAEAAAGERCEPLDAVLGELERERRAARRAGHRTVLLLVAAAPLAAAPLAFLAWLAAPGDEGLRAGLRAALQPHMLWVFVVAFASVPAALLLGLRAWLRHVVAPRNDWIAACKRRAWVALCAAHFPGIAYAPEDGMPWRLVDDSGLYPWPTDVYRSEDCFAGRRGATDVRFAEAVAQRERQRGWGSERETVHETWFRGIVFSADFHKHFHSTTRLVPRGEAFRRRDGESRAVLEDPAFEALFETWTTDQTDVRYVLSPALLERLTALAGACPGLRALFEGGRLLLLLPGTRDRFEPAFHRDARDRAQLDAFVADVQACLAIVDALDLNTRIWSKA